MYAINSLIIHMLTTLAPVPVTGLGAQEEFLALSVIGQVGKLIEEATAINNLSQMYIGWMPWL